MNALSSPCQHLPCIGEGRCSLCPSVFPDTGHTASPLLPHTTCHRLRHYICQHIAPKDLFFYTLNSAPPLLEPPSQSASPSPSLSPLKGWGPSSVSPILAYQVSSRLGISTELKDPSYHQGPFKEAWSPPSLHQLKKKKEKHCQCCHSALAWTKLPPNITAAFTVANNTSALGVRVVTERISQAGTVLRKLSHHHRHKYYRSK